MNLKIEETNKFINDINVANAKIKTINTLYKEGSLPKQLHERVTVKK